ncbi:hypothetical protein F4780DRAFT_108115 [Xylariomycetidae sp. FL0641]|nr:hypothetical protein F4780DRAFT_108115 [Xylariomycetidae sp. FL0641]
MYALDKLFTVWNIVLSTLLEPGKKTGDVGKLNGTIRWRTFDQRQQDCVGNSDQAALPSFHHARVSDCIGLRNHYNATDGHFEVTDWDDLEWFDVHTNGTCGFGLKRQSQETGEAICLGNVDIVSWINNALDYAENGLVGQGGKFRCKNLDEPERFEALEWRVWRLFPEVSTTRPSDEL